MPSIKIRGILVKCVDCQKQKAYEPRFGRTNRFSRSNFPFGDIIVNIYGPLNYEITLRESKIYILNIKDRCTRICRMIPLAGVTSKKTTKR